LEDRNGEHEKTTQNCEALNILKRSYAKFIRNMMMILLRHILSYLLNHYLSFPSIFKKSKLIKYCIYAVTILKIQSSTYILKAMSVFSHGFILWHSFSCWNNRRNRWFHL